MSRLLIPSGETSVSEQHSLQLTVFHRYNNCLYANVGNFLLFANILLKYFLEKRQPPAAVEHKSLFHKVLAIFRVNETATLKIASYLIDSRLRSTPYDQKKTTQKSSHKAKAQTAKLKDRAGIVGACMLARSRMFEI